MSDTFRLHFLHIDDQGSEVRTVRVSEADTIEDLCAKIEELGLEDPLRGYAPFRVGNMKVWQVSVVCAPCLLALCTTCPSSSTTMSGLGWMTKQSVRLSLDWLPRALKAASKRLQPTFAFLRQQHNFGLATMKPILFTLSSRASRVNLTHNVGK